MNCLSVFIIFLSIILFFSSLGLTKKIDSEDKNLQNVEQGKMSKVTYKGHTYVVWSLTCSGGLVHDPDCGCKREKLDD